MRQSFTGPLWKNFSGFMTPIALENDTSFITNRTSRSAPISSIGTSGNQIGGEARLDRPALIGEVAHLVAVRPDLENRGRGERRGLPGLQKVDYHFAARHVRNVIVSINGVRHLHAVRVGALHAFDRAIKARRVGLV